MAVSVTSTIRLGTGICLVAQHDVLMLAKQVATLDHLSGGRFEFGVGYGWNRLEIANKACGQGHTAYPKYSELLQPGLRLLFTGAAERRSTAPSSTRLAPSS